MSGIWRDIVPLALTLGAISFAAFAVPLAFAGATFARAAHSTTPGGWSNDGLVWFLGVATVISGLICFDIYLEAKAACDELRAGMATESVLPSLSGTSYSDQYLAKCTQSPF